jgi:lipoate-protein ligase A
VIVDGPRSGADNMATDEALLEDAVRSGRAVLRLYGWDPPTLSFGRNEPVAELYDLELIARRGIATVRRPTGGKAVWHEHEVTYAVAAPIAGFGSLRGAYVGIHRLLADALETIGVTAAIASAQPPIRPSAAPTSCFAAPLGGELLMHGRKLVGSAQVRRRDAFLQHGSILLDGSQELVQAVSRRPSAVSGEITLAEVLKRPVGFDEIAQVIASVAAR